MNALQYIKLAMLALGCVFGVYLGVRDLRVALSERAPAVFDAASFAERYEGQRWIEVRGRVAVEHRAVRASRSSAHAGQGRSYITAPVVGAGWSEGESVHVLATFGPFTRAELEGWPEEAARLEGAGGIIRPVPLDDAPFDALTLAEPQVVINVGTAPDLMTASLFSGLMLLGGGLAGFLLLTGLRELRRGSR